MGKLELLQAKLLHAEATELLRESTRHVTTFVKYLLNALAIKRLSLERFFPIFIVGEGFLAITAQKFFHCSPESLTVMTILLDDASVISFLSFFNLTSDAISKVAVFCPVL